jgi:hypothetical protein
MENEDWKWYIGLCEATFALISQDASLKSTLLADIDSILKQCRANPKQTIKYFMPPMKNSMISIVIRSCCLGGELEWLRWNLKSCFLSKVRYCLYTFLFGYLFPKADSSRSPDEIVKLAVQFFRDNATRPSIFRDLRPYLIVLNQNHLGKSFLQAISEIVDSEPKVYLPPFMYH